MTWSATQYSKFEAERNRPIRDLLAQVPNAEVAEAADLGCGPGNSTELLRERFPQAAILGLDTSPDMIAAARKRLPDLRFEIVDITAWSREPGAYDLILANASLQWVPDHATLLPALLAKLKPGGSLAVQTPDNLGEPAQRAMRALAAEAPFAQKLAGAARDFDVRHPAGWYFGLLRESGASVEIWRTTYHHALAGGPRAIIEWFRGTGLRPFLDRLDEDETALFLTRLETAIARDYPTLEDGTVLLPFPRLLYVARR